MAPRWRTQPGGPAGVMPMTWRVGLTSCTTRRMDFSTPGSRIFNSAGRELRTSSGRPRCSVVSPGTAARRRSATSAGGLCVPGASRRVRNRRFARCRPGAAVAGGRDTRLCASCRWRSCVISLTSGCRGTSQMEQLTQPFGPAIPAAMGAWRTLLATTGMRRDRHAVAADGRGRSWRASHPGPARVRRCSGQRRRQGGSSCRAGRWRTCAPMLGATTM